MVWRELVCTLGLIATACGDTTTEPDASTRSPACATQDQRLQAMLDTMRTSPNAILAVKNVECGNTVYTSAEFTSGSSGTDPGSLWRIGSITKTFVSAAILSLEKDGLLSLDDPLDRWVPNVANTTGVTIRMLLGHRSGIYNFTDDPYVLMHRGDPFTPRQLVDIATANPPVFPPDAGWSYSNTNYILLGMIVEAATGKKVGTVLHERAIDRASLAHTFFDGEDALGGTLITGYGQTGTDVTHAWDPSAVWTAGAMVATAGDLTDWVSALYSSDAVLDGAQRAELTTNATLYPDQGGGYGLGVMLTYVFPAGTGLGHNGAIDGFYSDARYFADKEVAVAAIVNKDGVLPQPILIGAINTLYR